jgi:ribosomal protein L7/L12
VRNGDKISAIKAYMEETGADLITAKKKIDEMA